MESSSTREDSAIAGTTERADVRTDGLLFSYSNRNVFDIRHTPSERVSTPSQCDNNRCVWRVRLCFCSDESTDRQRRAVNGTWTASGGGCVCGATPEDYVSYITHPFLKLHCCEMTWQRVLVFFIDHNQCAVYSVSEYAVSLFYLSRSLSFFLSFFLSLSLSLSLSPPPFSLSLFVVSSIV